MSKLTIRHVAQILLLVGIASITTLASAASTSIYGTILRTPSGDIIVKNPCICVTAENCPCDLLPIDIVTTPKVNLTLSKGSYSDIRELVNGLHVITIDSGEVVTQSVSIPVSDINIPRYYHRVLNDKEVSQRIGILSSTIDEALDELGDITAAQLGRQSGGDGKRHVKIYLNGDREFVEADGYTHCQDESAQMSCIGECPC